MIKRRFYKLEHGDRDGPSNSSSSSSDSEIEPEAIEDSDDDDDVVEELEEDAQACSTSSGFFILSWCYNLLKFIWFYLFVYLGIG